MKINIFIITLLKLITGSLSISQENNLKVSTFNFTLDVSPGYWESIRWPGGFIPYCFIPYYPNEARLRIQKAMKTITHNTCVKFKQIKFPGTNKMPCLKIGHWNNYEGCMSYVGYNVSALDSLLMNLNPSSEICTFGRLIHELMHILGFYHEHTRADRDDVVIIMVENIEEKKEKNFFIRPGGVELNLPYDYFSIMHYNPHSFSKDLHSKTIISKVPGGDDLMGQRTFLTTLDIAKINRYYKCVNHYRATELYPL